MARDIPVKFMEIFDLADDIDVNFGVCGYLVDMAAKREFVRRVETGEYCWFRYSRLE